MPRRWRHIPDQGLRPARRSLDGCRTRWLAFVNVWLINAFDVIASGLVLGGLVWGGWKLMHTRSGLEQERATARQIHEESDAARESGQEYDDRAERAKRGVRPALSYVDMVTLQQDVELMIVNYLRPELKGPFVVTAVGTLFGFARAVLVIFGLGS